MAGSAWWSVSARLAPFLIVCSFASVVSDPLCQETTPFHYSHPQLTCSDFTSAEELEQNVPQGSNRGDVELVLKDSRLDHIPPTVLQQIKPSVLVLNNVTVGSYRVPNSDASAFEELQDTLKKLVFYKNSSQPRSWALLKGNRLLKELLFFRMGPLRLGQDFNELPASVTDISVVQSTVSEVDDRWLSSLDNLESVRLDKVNLKRFERTMLPRPASKLRSLTITGTPLSALPEDFGEGFPALETLNLRRNKITTFEDRALAPFKDRKMDVLLTGNPVECDCKLLFLLGYPESWQYPNCKTPDALAKTPVRQLSADKLGCAAAAAADSPPPGRD